MPGWCDYKISPMLACASMGVFACDASTWIMGKRKMGELLKNHKKSVKGIYFVLTSCVVDGVFEKDE